MSLVRPPRLREFLDSDQELREDAVPGLFLLNLVESVVVGRRCIGPGEQLHRISSARESAEFWLNGSWDYSNASVGEDGIQRVVTLCLWEAELYEDPDLADRFEAALPPEMLEEQLALLELSSTDLMIWRPGVFDCYVCNGTRIGEAAVVVIEAGCLDPQLPDKADAVVCISCLEDAIARARSTTDR